MPRTRKPKSTANPDRNGFYRWTVEIEVHKTHVEDGFDLSGSDEADTHEIVRKLLPHAYGHEIKARVLSAPPRKAIRKAQGYTG